MAQCCLHQRLSRLERLFEAIASIVVEPTMIGAANPLLLDEPVVKGSASMGALLADESVPAIWRAKEDEILAKQAHTLLGVFDGEVARAAERLPIAAEKLPAGRARSYARQQLVFLLREHWPSRNSMARRERLSILPSICPGISARRTRALLRQPQRFR